jgi:hypothetical protein
MMPLRISVCAFALCFALTAFGDEAVNRFVGSWTVQGDPANGAPVTWVFETKGDSLKIDQMKGGEKLAEFECNTMGRECEMKEGGKKASVSMWFNGPKLVQLETKGSEIVRRRFQINPKGDAMDVEITPVSQGGKAETLHLTRAQVAAQHQ